MSLFTYFAIAIAAIALVGIAVLLVWINQNPPEDWQ